MIGTRLSLLETTLKRPKCLALKKKKSISTTNNDSKTFHRIKKYISFFIGPVNLLGRNGFSTFKGVIYFASSGDLTLKFPEEHEPDLLYSL